MQQWGRTTNNANRSLRSKASAQPMGVPGLSQPAESRFSLSAASISRSAGDNVAHMRYAPWDKKRDRRTLDHQALETIRLMVIERVREGERPSDVIAAYGFNRTTNYKWMQPRFSVWCRNHALQSRTVTGRLRTPTSAQERQVFRWIIAVIRASMASISGSGRVPLSYS